MLKNKIRYPLSGIRRRVAKGLDPVNYSIDLEDSDSPDDKIDG